MHPETARRLLEAWRNHRRPGRTHGAKVRDAVQHVHLSAVKKKCGHESRKDHLS